MEKTRIHCESGVFEIETDDTVELISKFQLKIGESIINFPVTLPLFLAEKSDLKN